MREDPMQDEPNEQSQDAETRAQELHARYGTVGRGMDSPDSTEVPLDATTGEPLRGRARLDEEDSTQASDNQDSTRGA